MWVRSSLVGLGALGLFAATYGPPEVIASIDVSDLTESSGLATSRRQPGILWTHNDSGHAPVLFAVTIAGKLLGRWHLRKTRMTDWEAMDIGPGPREGVDYLYIGDIGDNLSRRREITVLRVREPSVRAKSREAAAETLQFRYPDGPHDAEALAIHPVTGDLYIISKARGLDPKTIVYKAAAPHRAGAGPRPLTRVGELSLDPSLFSMVVGLVTGASIAPDGRRVALCSYTKAWEAVLRDGDSEFDGIWKGPWTPLDAGNRPAGEAIAYTAEGTALLLSSEGAPFDLVRLIRR
jgi:hypothetical protein